MVANNPLNCILLLKYIWILLFIYKANQCTSMIKKLLSKFVLGSLALAALTSSNAQVLTGTAFTVAPQLLVTNHHVIAGCKSIFVVTPEGRRAASLVSSEASIDLALIRVFGMRGTAASLRNARNVSLGETVSIFGFPLPGTLSTNGNFTSGLVSSLQGLRNTAGEIQITAPVQAGNSGAPVLDSSGLIVGVVKSKLDSVKAAVASGDLLQNVNFAIALDVLVDFLEINQVPFRSSAGSMNLNTSQVAELAQQFTFRIECEGSRPLPATQKQAPASLPQCAGENPKLWTNCFGTVNFSSGSLYVGEFKDGLFHGKGTSTTQSGTKYIGEFKGGRFDGQGTLTFDNGADYTGDFRDGVFHGQGTSTFPGGAKYVGFFRDGNRHGQGTYIAPSGATHVGEFRDGKPNGLGTYTFADGKKYVGEFKDGNYHGQGTMWGPTGNVIYSGRHINGKPAP